MQAHLTNHRQHGSADLL